MVESMMDHDRKYCTNILEPMGQCMNPILIENRNQQRNINEIFHDSSELRVKKLKQITVFAMQRDMFNQINHQIDLCKHVCTAKKTVYCTDNGMSLDVNMHR